MTTPITKVVNTPSSEIANLTGNNAWTGNQTHAGTETFNNDTFFTDDMLVGDDTNYVKITEATGQISWGGTYKKFLSMRPAFQAGATGRSGSPTVNVLGAYAYYTMPIWDSGANVNKELYWRLNVPGRWDGASDIVYKLTVCLSAAEDVGDDFKLELDWARKSTDSGVIASSVTNVPMDTNITTDRNAQYSIYEIEFTIDWDTLDPDIVAGDLLVGRIRRTATAGTEITGDIWVLDHNLKFQVDKVFKAT